jgi:hypothetical protein
MGDPPTAYIEITVELVNPQIPVPNAKVCMYREGVCHWIAYTDANGKALFPFYPIAGKYYFTATKQTVGGALGDVCIIPDTVSFDPSLIPPGSAKIIEEEEKPVWNLSVSNNPVSSMSSISYSVAENVPVSLRIFDASGRAVTTLASGSHAPGRYVISWNGCDAVGASCPAGIYFVKMEAEGFSANQRLVLIK